MQIFINTSIYIAALFGPELHTRGTEGLFSAFILTFFLVCVKDAARNATK